MKVPGAMQSFNVPGVLGKLNGHNLSLMLGHYFVLDCSAFEVWNVAFDNPMGVGFSDS